MNERTALLSMTYFGPIHYFTKFLLYPEIRIERYDNYTKQTYRNRCVIYSSNGKLTLSIPVLKGDEHKILTKDIRIDNQKQWQKLHWRGIESAYRSSPFYEYYIDGIARFYEKRYDYLFDYNLEILYAIIKMLDVEVTIGFTDEYIADNHGNFEDMRELIHPKKPCLSDPAFSPVGYDQVFNSRHGFIPNLSIIDLIFNEGPGAVEILKKSIIIS
ncbi:MAG: hypothetical protein AMS27_00900 [Bacteroides sp. SM23_62_1]|nr:MAG: hypothetical protein AMS27_00900 [Bacteroides sp. SM23_62_1]